MGSKSFKSEKILEELKQEGEAQRQKVRRLGAGLLIASSLAVFAIFITIFYLSPRQAVDIATLILSFVLGGGIFAVGFFRLLH
jgi:hypothetical protein